MSIKNLTEISSLVTKNKQFSTLQLDENEQNADSTKYIRLIEGLTKEHWKSDEDARADLYGSSTGSKSFEMLKSRAKERLVSMIFQADSKRMFISAKDRAYFNACKSFLSGYILFNKTKFSSGQEQLKLALKTSREFQFFDIELLTLRLLRRFSSFSGNEKLYQKLSTEIKHVKSQIDAEMEAEDLELELQAFLVNSVDVTDVWLKKLEHNYSRMKEIAANNPVNSIKVNYFKISMRYYQAKEDYNKSIEVAEEFSRFLNSDPRFLVKARLANVSLNKLYCCLYLKDYSRGAMFAAECDELTDPGSINWLIFKEYHFLLCMHTSQFGKAASIFDQVLRHPSFDSYPAANVEKWKIFEAYLEYANPIATQVRRKFNVAKFLNEVPVFTKDKSGYNLSIILAQIMLAVKTNEFHRVIDRAESLKVYLSRHVKKEKHTRSYYFLKMLQVMIRYEFDPVKTSQIADKFLAKMKQSGPASPESSEVIPYEWLWADLMLRLREHQSQNQ